MKATHLVVISAMFVGISASAQDVKVDVSALPKEASKFITQHFTDTSITRVTRDNDGTFEVKLNNGTEIEFSGNGTWHEVDGKGNPIAASYVPVSVLEYIQTNYASDSITKIEQDSRGYDVDLSNGTELEFDLAGKFLRVDR